MKFTTPFLSVAATASFFLTAAAAPPGGNPVAQCTRGVRVCCEDVKVPNAVDVRTNAMLALLGIKVKGLQGLVGSTCRALDLPVLGVNTSCPPEQQLCCKNNLLNGLVSIGCTPINVV
ncbi:hypothetical protein EST38_g14061 [Candolleomyces aberdarensis]|uniref:Hydrophobin n=1 Tax=Candolleomyces aberdarensis TaxID=2316362 RepID=A0A4Q2CYE0_9AGAR|nr:hypothetical protein EST38_g14061 [Candolleomyces aberdarensis]